MPPEQAEQIAQWERELAQYSHRSDSSGFAGRIGEEVLRALLRARLANAALNIAYRRSIEKRLELERYIAAQEAISSAPPCECSPGDLCTCAYDCDCMERYAHEYIEGRGRRNEGPAGCPNCGVPGGERYWQSHFHEGEWLCPRTPAHSADTEVR